MAMPIARAKTTMKPANKIEVEGGGGARGRLESQNNIVAHLDARASQIDAAIAEATRRGRTNTAPSAMEAQRRARASLVDANRP
jgi:hypothetical protein